MKNRWHLIISHLNSNGFKINLFLFSSVLIISISQLNRAFSIGGIVAICFLLFFYQRIKFRKIHIISVFASIFFLIILTAFLFKNDSTLGRLFIYKISWRIFKEHYIFGIGLDNFQIEYGLYQAQYFKEGSFTEKEFLLADNVFYAFNDYWQFIIETGLVGAGVLFVGGYIIYRLIKRIIRQQPFNTISALCIGIFVVVCTAALFTHVFEKKIFQLLIAVIVIHFFTLSNRTKIIFRGKQIIIAISLATVLFLQNYRYITNIPGYRKFKEAEDLWAVGYRLSAQKTVQQIYSSLDNDIEFLIFYSNSFYSKSDYQKKVNAYNVLLSRITDYRLYLEQGKNYENLLLFNKAEQFYLTAMYMVPNRFQTRSMLINLYIKNNKLDDAKSLAIYTLNMPVKIPSEQVNKIKNSIAEKVNTK